MPFRLSSVLLDIYLVHCDVAEHKQSKFKLRLNINTVSFLIDRFLIDLN